MLELYLIRHAESEMNQTPNFICGRSNWARLTETGIEQAELLGKRFRDEYLRFDEIYSSIALRAETTANIVCNKMGHSLDEIILSEDLVELNVGTWEGKIRNSIYTPKIIKKIKSDPWNFRAPNGESQKDVEERMYKFLENYLLDKIDQDLKVGIFTHGFAIKCLFRKIMDSDPSLTYLIEVDNTSITQFNYTNKGLWKLVKLNDNTHLNRRVYKP